MRAFNSVFTLARGINGWRFAKGVSLLLLKSIVMAPFFIVAPSALAVVGMPPERLAEMVSVGDLASFVVKSYPLALGLSVFVVGAIELRCQRARPIGREATKEVSHGG